MAYICGLGQFEMFLNGEKVGDHFLDPAWTKFDKEAQYVAFDITGELRDGKNAVGVCSVTAITTRRTGVT